MRPSPAGAILARMDLRLDLPSPCAEFVDEQVASGSYASAIDCVAALVQADARARAQERLEAELLKGLESPTRRWTPELMDEIRQVAHLRR